MHIYANPTRFLSLAKWLMPLLFWSGLVLAAGALVWGLAVVPPDRLMGDTVRILFIHVPAAWLGMGGWAGIALCSAMLLIWKHPLAAIAARAIAVPGMVFCAICLATGSIWGRPTWGTWWEWDGRLTSMLVLLFLYAGYIALTQATAREGGSARIAAIFGIVGAVNVPIVKFSVEWLNSLHQGSTLLKMGKPTMSAAMAGPLYAALAGTMLFCAFAVLRRMQNELLLRERGTRWVRELQRAQAVDDGSASA